ncbi:MAG: type I-C CRISPR-associated protein Cas8c/Csd1 [Acidobacteriota bacterium]|nr:type I-C CRISPR-associated protein Cas8c/Csd1 [Blastocatellia bacterium]MDW8413025.1 type I-C CRISPR-associated protein Cas8c/Csd1 [Acidobacteriota bacterium]
MLLKAVADFYNSTLEKNQDINPAFTKKSIRWIIPLDLQGNLIGCGLIETDQTLLVPSTTRPKGSGQVAEFLWGGLEIFCLSDKEDDTQSPAKKARVEENLRAKYQDFWKQVEEAYKATQLPIFEALLQFKQKYTATNAFPPFLQKDYTAKNKLEWKITKADKKQEKYKGGDYFSFQVNNRIILQEDTVRNYWSECYKREKEALDKESPAGICLITGNTNVPIARVHLPKIQGVPGAQSSGAAVVSFDKDAFLSYGFEQSLNAPISTRAVESYCRGLNHLLSSNNHRFILAKTVICFWTKQNSPLTGIFSNLLDQPTTDNIKKFLAAPYSGNQDSIASVENDLFYSTTLSANGGRIIVRHWMQLLLSQAVSNFQQWFRDLEIVSLPDRENISPFGIRRLANATRRKEEKADSLLSETILQLYRAALESTAPSMMLVQQILQVFRKELAKDGRDAIYNTSRFALLKLILNRNRKERHPHMEPELITDTDDPAYNCGRLLAVFDELQHSAHDYKLEGASIAEKYYGSASTTPNAAFAILWRLHQHHLRKLSRDNPKAAVAIKGKIADIACKFRPADRGSAPCFPHFFDLHAQGRFALGFYQQIAVDRAQRKASLEKKSSQQGD